MLLRGFVDLGSARHDVESAFVDDPEVAEAGARHAAVSAGCREFTA